MRKAKEKTDFGKHQANVRKMSSALTGYGTVYNSLDGRMCGLIAPSMAALQRTFAQLCDAKFNPRVVRKVILFEQKNVSAIKKSR